MSNYQSTGYVDTHSPGAPTPPKAPGIGSFTGIDRINPYEDPTYGAYMRGLGVNESNLQAEIALRQNQLGQQQQSEQPVFAEQLQNGLRQIGGNYEDRGAFNSGMRAQDQTQFSGDVARQKSQFNQGITNSHDDLAMQLAQGIAGYQQGAAEQGLNAKMNIALMNANAGLYQ